MTAKFLLKNNLSLLLVTQFTVLLMCTPIEPLFKILLKNIFHQFFSLYALIFICENLPLFMIICENLFFFVKIFFIYDRLWESILFCENLFEPFLSVRISAYLWWSMRIEFFLNSSHFVSDYFRVKQNVFVLISLSSKMYSFCRIKFFTINIFQRLHLWV